jgi:hypothetical protein
VNPGRVAAAFRHRRDASILLERIGRGVAVAWFAESDEETRGKDGTSAWYSLKQGEVRRALGALRNSAVDVRDRVQGHAQLADEGLDQEGMGDADALIGGQRRGALDGVDALIDDVGIADVVRPEKALQGRAARELGGLERWPWGEKIAEDGRVVVVKPWQDMISGSC